MAASAVVLMAAGDNGGGSSPSATAAPVGDGGSTNAPPHKVAITPEEMAAQKEAKIAKFGGRVEKPGAMQGRIMILDAQKAIGPKDIETALDAFGPSLRKFDVVVRRVAPGLDFAAMKRSNGATIAVILVDDDVTPSLLVAPDDQWAAMNVRRFGKNLLTPAAREKFFASRCRKGLIRAFAAAAGGLGSTFPDNVMDVASVEELDLCEEFLPYDKFAVIKHCFKQVGLKPRHIVSYAKACREGWAPAPTNDVQRAIWEKAKADKERGPSNPIKIDPPGRK